MTPYRNRLKTPEEIELAKKREELSRFQWHLAELERTFAELKAEIRLFEQSYEKTLGARISSLEDLEWQLKGLLDSDDILHDVDTAACEESLSHFHHRTDLLDEDDAPLSDEPRKSLKSLYREVAKAIHPDLASDGEERLRRQELMAIANQAYGDGDRVALEDILSDWELGPEQEPGTDVVFELVRIIRLIARVQQNIHAVIRQMEELKATDIYSFKLRVDEASLDGIDLMAEMAAKVDLDIRKIRRRLAAVRGEDDGQDQEKAPLPATRLLRFPVAHSCGMLYERSAGSVDYRDWQRLGHARGVREVQLDMAVRLDVKGRGGAGMEFLDDLLPDDLQALYLYDIEDSALEHLVHLSGLNELYLSNTTISDKGLRLLGTLHGLRRLSIYHTAISDAGLDSLTLLKGLKWLTCSGTNISTEGLARFRQQAPDCKAVNFEWRHGK
jgi:hypothetical protein